jgi:NADP-dependent 3-hydroxy acid dehydrogenase YdfG
LNVQQELAATGAEVDCTVVDVRSRDKVKAWIEKVVQKFGKVDGLAICAGVSGKQLNALIQDIDEDDWDFVFGVNIKGTMNTLRACIPNLNNRALIVIIASLENTISPNRTTKVGLGCPQGRKLPAPKAETYL